MPTVLLIGIPIVVAILLWAILSLPDEEEKEEKEAPPSEEKPLKPKLTPKKRKKK